MGKGHGFSYMQFMDDWIIQALGIAAGACTALSLLPQVIKMFKEKKAEDLSVAYLFILLSGQILWIVYGSLRKDPPVVVTNIVSLTVNLITIFLGLKYKRNPGS